MTQVIGRALLKQLQNAMSGKKVDDNAKYLLQLEQLITLKSKVKEDKDWTPETIFEALKVRAASSVYSVGNTVQ